MSGLPAMGLRSRELRVTAAHILQQQPVEAPQDITRGAFL